MQNKGCWRLSAEDWLPDVRDGLSRVQRIVLYELHKAQEELKRTYVPTALLYGRVVEQINISPEQLHAVLVQLGARKV